MSTGSTASAVVICGSMRNFDLMIKIGDLLRSAGLTVIVPAPDDQFSGWLAESSKQRKRAASLQHMRHIRDRGTAAILVVNVDRPGARHYVGPNALAEIGVAFSDGRLVFLLHGMPDMYADELEAWGVTCLNGEVRPLLDALSVSPPISPPGWREVVRQVAV